MTTLHLDLSERGYDITVGRGLLANVSEYFNLNRRVFIVTDSGVPEVYAKTVASFAKESMIVTVAEGEGSKSPEVYVSLLNKMVEFGMTRSDCAVAVGGGVVGDLTGFLSATYMRGIDFYNIPTTLLSQVDSSIGGKTAINHKELKNIVGAFYQPKGVIIDPDLLHTLPKRQISSGMAEAIKMALSCDKELFEMIESGADIEDIIIGALKIKKKIVESDERESGVRRVLNLGHTLGHAIEAAGGGLYHGECVAIGMLVVCSDEVRERLIPLLKKYDLPTEYKNTNDVLEKIALDKKNEGDKISVIYVDKIGSYRIEKESIKDFTLHISEEGK